VPSTPILVIDSSPAAREQALSRLLTLSASVSYTDAVVMAVADEYQTQKISGFDEAFANCGYENIPRWSEAEAA
jgi:predicted nucleic acid-binding protein